MIKVQGNFKPSADSRTVFAGDLFLFVKTYLNTAGGTENEAIIYADQSITEQVGAVRLPNYSAEELVGGAGANEYEKIIDKVQDLAIANFKTFNQGVTFSKVLPTQPEAPVEDAVVEE
jgi:hypothetical protein